MMQDCGTGSNTSSQISHADDASGNSMESCTVGLTGAISTRQNGSEPNASSLKCSICWVTLPCTVSLKQHKKTHDNETPTCNVCSKPFNTFAAMKYHRWKHAGQEFSCTFCQKVFREKGSLARHVRIHIGDRPYICTECPLTFSSRSGLHGHKKNVHERDFKFHCTVCDRRFISRYHYTEHCKQHNVQQTADKPHKCSSCGHVFPTERAVKRHQRTGCMVLKRYDNSAKCPLCLNIFTSKYYIKTHLLKGLCTALPLVKEGGTNTAPGQLTDANSVPGQLTDDCPPENNMSGNTSSPPTTAQDSTSNVQEHAKITDDVLTTLAANPATKWIFETKVEGPYKCGVCWLVLPDNSALIAHRKSHANESPTCNICSKPCPSFPAMKKHREKHEMKPFSCSQCYKLFTNQAELDEHAKMHFADRPYTCHVCDKSFKAKSSFYGHKSLAHQATEKRHHCEICDQRFYSKAKYKKHYEKHNVQPTAEKPYQCSACSYIFTSAKVLSRHRQTACTVLRVNVNSSECPICKMTFCNRLYIKRHLNKGLCPGRPEKSPLKKAPTTGHDDIDSEDDDDGDEMEPMNFDNYESSNSPIIFNTEEVFKEVDMNMKNGNNIKTESGETDVVENSPTEEATTKPAKKTTPCRKTRYKCLKCQQNFLFLRTFRQHQKQHHVVMKPVTCPVCFESFLVKSGLSEHSVVHRNKTPHTCVICCTGFTDQEQLTSHMMEHTQILPFSCHICVDTFPDTEDLTKHLKSHKTCVLGVDGADEGIENIQPDDVTMAESSSPLSETREIEGSYVNDKSSSPLSETGQIEGSYVNDKSSSPLSETGRIEGSYVKEDHVKWSEVKEPAIIDAATAPTLEVKGYPIQPLQPNADDGLDAETVTCIICGTSLPNSESLLQHLVALHSETGSRPHKCSECDKSFVLENSLKLHFKHTHKDSPIYNATTCDICLKQFPTRKHLNKHVITHSTLKPHSCDICSKSFLTLAYLNRHMLDHNRAFPCTVCGKRFGTNQALVRHNRAHENKRQLMCHICSATFNCQTSLTMHIRWHQDIRNHPCKLCDRKFRTASALREHYKVHNNDRAYLCNVCPQSCYTASNLRRHMRTHTGEKPVICNVCQKGFATKHGLRGHMQTHGARPDYTCEVCNQQFIHKESYKRHVALHSGVKEHKCEVCPAEFARRVGLRTHMLKVHSTSLPLYVYKRHYDRASVNVQFPFSSEAKID